jgi:hypothetical protein
MPGLVPWSVMLAMLLANKNSFCLGEGGHDHSSKRSRLYSPLSALGREAFLLVCAALFSVACVAVSTLSGEVLPNWIQGHQARMAAGVGLLTASSICSSIFAITAACAGLRSGRPRRLRASSGVQSISTWIFTGAPSMVVHRATQDWTTLYP